ncbi:MAG: dihydrodipicolinate synthase family protein [Firmicutes bacterium]|nr:dihydrodipicolinate synthase family protein [Bacillota bacterium]
MDGSAICGSISLAVTPFLDHGAIDWNAFDPLMDFHASAGSGGFFALGGTSEMNGWTLDEWVQGARLCVLRRGTRSVVACGNGSMDERVHPDEVRAMVDTGVDSFVLARPPRMRVPGFDLWHRLSKA